MQRFGGSSLHAEIWRRICRTAGSQPLHVACSRNGRESRTCCVGVGLVRRFVESRLNVLACLLRSPPGASDAEAAHAVTCATCLAAPHLGNPFPDKHRWIWMVVWRGITTRTRGSRQTKPACQLLSRRRCTVGASVGRRTFVGSALRVT